MEHPGNFDERPTGDTGGRDFTERAFTVGLGGPVGSGKPTISLVVMVASSIDFDELDFSNDCSSHLISTLSCFCQYR